MRFAGVVLSAEDPVARVLIADDHIDTRIILRHYFEAMGFIVSEAADGREALECVRGDDRPDAVVLDIQMPHLDGIGVLREIRRDAGLSSLPVLALSAHAMVEEVREIIEAGADRYLAKPADPKEVIAAIRALLAAR